MKKIIYGIVFLVLLTSSAFAQQQKNVVDLVLPTENTELEYISKKISETTFFTVNTYIKNLPDPAHRGNILLIVSDKLLPLLDNTEYAANFALYVNSLNFQKKNNSKSSALYSDQSLHRQLSLLSAIFTKEIRLGIPYQNEKYNDLLHKEMNNFPLINYLILKIDNSNKLRTINKVIQNSDVLFAISESNLYNSQTIKSILLSSYRHQTAVIGPNEGFVTAGALASVVTSSDQYIEEIIDLVKQYIDTSRIPDAKHPKNFLVKTNRNVAEALGLELPSDEYLRLKIKDD